MNSIIETYKLIAEALQEAVLFTNKTNNPNNTFFLPRRLDVGEDLDVFLSFNLYPENQAEEEVWRSWFIRQPLWYSVRGSVLAFNDALLISRNTDIKNNLFVTQTLPALRRARWNVFQLVIWFQYFVQTNHRLRLKLHRDLTTQYDEHDLLEAYNKYVELLKNFTVFNTKNTKDTASLNQERASLEKESLESLLKKSMKTDIEKFKQSLQAEHVILLGELKGLGAMRNPDTNDWDAVPEESAPEADENDRADRAEDYEERTALVNTLKARFKDVEHALEKVGKASFGICEVCNEPIEIERLEANPAARTCMKHINE